MALDVIFEMQCDDCGSVFEIATNEENEHEPMYCTFCGNEIIEEAIFEDDEDTYSDEELNEVFKPENEL